MNDKTIYLNEKEEKVMKALWESGSPLSASEIAAYINEDWAYKSVQNVIRKLETNSIIEVAEITKIGKTYGRLFKAALSADDYAIMQLNKLCENNSDISFIVSNLIKNKNNKMLSQKLKKIMEEFNDNL